MFRANFKMNVLLNMNLLKAKDLPLKNPSLKCRH